ncbi:MAG: hypothetical protein QE495_08145 [Acidovorax sp.]|uniref:hypothetical protein n=1 Tax=Acidovorax sp. TaxID=1872122 RepID=UPI0026229281|nr:hypothetical protein [Acidovorax sp.]MDH4426407.1 hypothetical protein [Acidovorax sp.]MDH4464884.1 hypothetical protein [Acidovorax sp.]
MFFKKFVAVTVFMGALAAHAFAPQAGTWVVAAELDGKPGRGLAIDVQNETLVMQVYAYESNGQPSFFLAAGPYSNNQFSGPLTRYEGGRFFGSGARSGVAVGSPGNVNLRFTSGVTGFATFPGEPEKAIIRANFAYPFAPSSLVGIWTFTSIGSEGLVADAVPLGSNIGATSSGNGLVVSSDGLFGCEHQISGSLSGGVLCVKINSQSQLVRSYYFVYSINEGEGFSQRNGNGTQQLLSVRRLTTPRGVGTGVAIKANEASAADYPAIRAHISEVARSLQ